METSNNNTHFGPNSRLRAFLKTTHILAFVCLVICSGCGTIIGRSGVGDMAYDVKIPRYYPATFVDSRLIAESSPNTSAGARAFWCVGGVIDLPISLVLDTLLFPYDACKSSKQTSSPVSKPPEPIAETEMNTKARKMLEAQNKPVEVWGMGVTWLVLSSQRQILQKPSHASPGQAAKSDGQEKQKQEEIEIKQKY